MASQKTDAPVLIDLDETDPANTISPADVAAIEDDGPAPNGQAMRTMTALAARPSSRLIGWFWKLLLAVVVFFVSLAAWQAVTGLIQQNVVLGWAATGLIAAFSFVCLALILKEISALTRLRRVEVLQTEAARVLSDNDVEGARNWVRRISAFYKGRGEVLWGQKELDSRIGEIFDAKTGLLLVEDTIVRPLDDVAAREIELAARQVATITALVPLAFADVLTALTVNLRMIRRISEIYGGRAGTLGAWRLTRAVAAHLVATGAVAVGDDLLGSLGGGHLLGKLSRRFGEGLVNGALTARVGVAAIEVCRPMPFVQADRPRVSKLISRALTGLFDR